MSSGIPRWWKRRSLRARLTIATTAGLALALALAAVTLHEALRASQIRELNGTALRGGRQVAALANAHRLPHPAPVNVGTLTIQVLGADGRIVDASPGADLLVPLLPRAQAAAMARSGRGMMLDGRPYGIPYELWVVAVPARGQMTVVAAADFAGVTESVDILTRSLLIGMPLLLLLLAFVTWLVVGYTLRPIEALRRGAQRVTTTGRPRALPVPEAHDEVRDLADTLNDMLSRLGAAQQQQRDLVSDTAHELRSPIASIRAQLEVALDHPDGMDWQQLAGDVLTDTLRLARLVEDLLVLARLDERTDQSRRPVDLVSLATGEAARVAGGRVPVTVTADGQCLVTGNFEGLRRLLVNLIENALRYASTKVDVAAGCTDGVAWLSVTDDGPGIPPRDRERAFRRFVRLDDARSRDEAGTSGAGLGLAIVAATAAAHGGSARLEDACPGLRAVVSFPAQARA